MLAFRLEPSLAPGDMGLSSWPLIHLYREGRERRGSTAAGSHDDRRDVSHSTGSHTTHLPPTRRQRRLITQAPEWQEAVMPGNLEAVCHNLWSALIIYLSYKHSGLSRKFFFNLFSHGVSIFF